MLRDFTSMAPLTLLTCFFHPDALFLLRAPVLLSAPGTVPTLTPQRHTLDVDVRASAVIITTVF